MSTQKQELEALKRMMETDGWHLFHKAQKEQVQALRLTSWDSVKTLEQLHYMRGFLAALEGVVNYQNIVEAGEASVGSNEENQ